MKTKSLPIIEWPHPTLRSPAQVVNDFDQDLEELVEQMWSTMYTAPGIGLAAPQVNISQRIFVMDCSARDETSRQIIAINPRLSNLQGSVDSSEGCLSFPGLSITVPRAASVTLDAYDLSGNSFTLKLAGLEAICAQHEFDHLEGKSFLDHLTPHERLLALKDYLRELESTGSKNHEIIELTQKALEEALNEVLNP